MADCGRCVQARCHAGYCHWLGQPERRRVVQHLPRRRRASVLSGTRGGAGIFSAVSVWRISSAVCPSPTGERETSSGRSRPLDNRTGETGDREAWRQAARLYIHAVAAIPNQDQTTSPLSFHQSKVYIYSSPLTVQTASRKV